MRVLLIGVAAALLAAGCGQKGPLYLPDKNRTAVTPDGAQPPPAQSGTTTPKKSDKDDTAPPPPQ
jgi:predicted small lipoprotein YifL